MMMRYLCTFFLFVLGASAQIQAPATFDSLYPCVDCGGVRTTLTLRDNGVFVMRRTMLRSVPATTFSMGRWVFTGKKLTLLTTEFINRHFALKDTGELEMLDQAGRATGSKVPYLLVRQPIVNPMDGTMPLRGRYSYMADAAWFEECNTGKRFPVGPAPGNARLEAAYGRVRKEPGTPVVVSVLGHIASVAKVEGDGLREALVVDSLQRFMPGAACSAAKLPLEGVTWRLMERAGVPVASTGDGERDAHLMLDNGNVYGSSGCNRVVGGYTSKAGALKFGPTVGTRMFCEGPGMAIEQGFLQDMNKTTSYRIRGITLELMAGTTVLAKLSAGQ
jgi:copper homeostasis protein (lipoprotein)